jgi:hypothetical protein
VNAYYATMAREFAGRLAGFHPTRAYHSIRTTALDLASHGFDLVPHELAIVAPREATRRRQELVERLVRGYEAYGQGRLQEALEAVLDAVKQADRDGDPLSAIDALHLQGRVQYDLERLGEATDCFAEEMDRSQRAACVPGFVRAVHEVSRVCSREFDVVRAEFGFRLAVDYYLAAGRANDSSWEDDAPGSDGQNFQAALRCLGSLAQTYALLEEGPTEADAVIDRLASPDLSAKDESGLIFLEIRYLAIAALTSLRRHAPVLARMVRRAAGLQAVYPRLSALLREEAAYVSALTGTPLPGAS